MQKDRKRNRGMKKYLQKIKMNCDEVSYAYAPL